MKWMRFRVRTNAASEDIIVAAMADLGLFGAQIEDKVPLSGRELEELFVDEAPVPTIADDSGEADLACLNFYVEIAEEPEGDPASGNRAAEGITGHDLCLKLGEDGTTVSPEEMVDRMQEVLGELRQFSDIGDGTVSVSVTEDIDWRDNWKQYFHKFFIDDVLVLPSWECADEAETAQAVCTLRIDPGAAFGTGLHETTQLAVRALRRAIQGEGSASAASPTVLDVGTGSGVLSILALQFGAARAVGVDLDPLAVSAAAENRERNGFSEERMTVLRGDLIGDAAFRAAVRGLADGGYDILVANILPNVLVPLAPVVPALLKEDGTLLYSGILLDRAEEVAAALMRAGFAVTARETLGEWCALAAVSKDRAG